MRIIAIHAYHALPSFSPTLPHTNGPKNSLVVVRVCTEKYEGFGEVVVSKTEEATRILSSIKSTFAPLLVGKFCAESNAFQKLLLITQCGDPFAKTAIDMALWDLLGKLHGVPICRLMGGKVRDSIPLHLTVPPLDKNATIAFLQDKVSRGFRVFNIEMHESNIEAEVDRIKTIDKMFGRIIKYHLSPRQKWNLTQALQFCEGTLGCRIDFIHQPVPIDQHSNYSRLASSTPCPISLNFDSDSFIKHSAEFKSGKISIITSEFGPVSLSSSKNIAEGSKFLNSWFRLVLKGPLGLTHAAAVQMLSTVPNFLDCGLNYSPESICEWIQFPRRETNCKLNIGNLPGLGVFVDIAKLEQRSVSRLSFTHESCNECFEAAGSSSLNAPHTVSSPVAHAEFVY